MSAGGNGCRGGRARGRGSSDNRPTNASLPRGMSTCTTPRDKSSLPHNTQSVIKQEMCTGDTQQERGAIVQPGIESGSNPSVPSGSQNTGGAARSSIDIDDEQHVNPDDNVTPEMLLIPPTPAIRSTRTVVSRLRFFRRMKG